MQVTIHQAKTQLSKLIAAVERGEEVIIYRRDQPVVQLNLVGGFTGKTRIGGLKGRKLRMGLKFDDPTLNEEITKSFNDS
jgi:antitoxin (DNA-binding transcriptional repressor) of toxin-antitoxin stability system